jgi:REP element-mobilizing transposase RayT
MAIHKIHEPSENTWFITFTCYNWLPLFEIASAYHIVYSWLKLIDNKYQIKTLAFVIMPNHFMAYELIKLLTEMKHISLIDILASACSEKEKAKGQKHKVFEPSFDAKAVYSFDFLHQKLDYIHRNPVSGKWNLSKEFTDYPHSSASFYVDEKLHEVMPVTDYRDYWQ